MAKKQSMGMKTTHRYGWIKAFLLTGLVAILAMIPLMIKSVYLLHIFILVLVYVIAASSLRTIAISGQMSLGHAGFMGIGAYTSAILAKQLEWTPWVTMPLGALAAMVVAIMVGYPFSRLRTFYFSMVSLFFGIGILAINTIFSRFTGGYYGLAGIPPLFVASKVPFFFFFLGLTVFCLLILYRFETCRIGTSLKAVAQSHAVAASVGINESGYRVLALAAGSFVVGLAGAGYGHYNLVLSHSTFDLVASINLMVYMIVGGMSSFAGPIVGAAILVIIPEMFRDLKMYTPYVFAGVVILIIFLVPQGLVGLYEKTGFLIKKSDDGGQDGRVA
ncbi:MAG: branched-chain amino acid ABC transporter permease [Deltaproteobacteria bacterium]|nr:branched-chain amino acid ABC transporter permease [Deltaproteobacteria bacterium]